MSLKSAHAARRGRPPKFGRPAELITLTLPLDTIAWLRTLHPDPAWAVVKLQERAERGRTAVAASRPSVELAQIPGRQGLILVRAELFSHLRGVQIIQLADGRGFLALAPDRGPVDLEIAVVDRLDEPNITEAERQALRELREKLRTWRQTGIRFETRSILVAERGVADGPPEPLTPVKQETNDGAHLPHSRRRSSRK